MTGCIWSTSGSMLTSVPQQPPFGSTQELWQASYGFCTKWWTQDPDASLLSPATILPCHPHPEVSAHVESGLACLSLSPNAGVQRLACNSLGNAGKLRLLCLTLRPKSGA